MSLFSWLSPRKKTQAAARSGPLTVVDSALNSEGTLLLVPRRGAEAAKPSSRKTERMARRELLYAVVRECMVRSGVLSSSYKFKVLSLDARGRQFLVMVDLARQHDSETGRLAEIEAMIAQAAKARHDIAVTAVYWRMNEHVAVGKPPAPAAQVSRPAPLEPAPAGRPQAAAPAVPAAPVAALDRRTGERFEPIDADEVAAFRQALASGTARPAARGFDGKAVQGPQSYTLLTGYEDTELPEADERAALSGTQYGELR